MSDPLLEIVPERTLGPHFQSPFPDCMTSCCSARPGLGAWQEKQLALGSQRQTHRHTDRRRRSDTRRHSGGGEGNRPPSPGAQAAGPRPSWTAGGSLEKSDRHKGLLTSPGGTLVAFVCVGCRATPAPAWPQSPEPGAGPAVPWGLGWERPFSRGVGACVPVHPSRLAPLWSVWPLGPCSGRVFVTRSVECSSQLLPTQPHALDQFPAPHQVSGNYPGGLKEIHRPQALRCHPPSQSSGPGRVAPFRR